MAQPCCAILDKTKTDASHRTIQTLAAGTTCPPAMAFTAGIMKALAYRI
jgi:hypothetical protein